MSISAPCHPERSEGPFLETAQRSLATLGMTKVRTLTHLPNALPLLFPFLKALPHGNHRRPERSEGSHVGNGFGVAGDRSFAALRMTRCGSGAAMTADLKSCLFKALPRGNRCRPERSEGPHVGNGVGVAGDRSFATLRMT